MSWERYNIIGGFIAAAIMELLCACRRCKMTPA